jgi:hypothetical protein
MKSIGPAIRYLLTYTLFLILSLPLFVPWIAVAKDVDSALALDTPTIGTHLLHG